MRTLLRATDPILISFAEATLRAAGITTHIADQFTSGVEGSIGIFPRRLMVADADYAHARRTLVDAGVSSELAPEETKR
jgi:hypothetical protein